MLNYLARIVAIALLLPQLAHAADPPVVKVYKSPTCGCCSKWIRHLEQSGFEVEAENVANVGVIKQANGLPPYLTSCHTAIVDGYIVEGHVPAEDIFRLLKEKPDIAGIAVPRMPAGSPGMEAPEPEPYSVLAFDKDGNITEFARHPKD